MSIPLGEAIVLGLVQGITAVVPVSSDGHLAIAEKLYGTRASLALTVLLHVGTLAATVLVLRKRVWMALEEGLRGLSRPALWKDTPGGQDALFVVVATVPTVLIGVALRTWVAEGSDSLWLIGLGFLGSAVAVASTKWAPRGDEMVPTLLGSVLVGVAQGSAAFPGLSRSAVTIATLLWLGVAAERAFELAFLVSLPALSGAVILEGRRAFTDAPSAAALVLATCVAFGVGVFALVGLRRAMTAGKVSWFAFYLVPMTLATLAWARAQP